MNKLLQKNARPLRVSSGLLAFVVVGIVGFFILLSGRGAWATPAQSPLSQTIPPSGCIGGVVFCDFDCNWFEDEGECGMLYATVELWDITGTLVMTTTTDIGGYYSFCGLEEGFYVVYEIPPDDFCCCVPTDCCYNTTPNPLPVFLPSGGSVTADFGHKLCCVISGRVFNDLDGDGIQGPGEEGIHFVQIDLMDGFGNLIGTTRTNIDGLYIFTDLAPGSYTVVETDLAGYFSTTSNVIHVSKVEDGTAVANFGDIRLGTVSGFVFDDLDGDGYRGSRERGLAGVTVYLEDYLGTVVATTMTDLDGWYQFTALSPDAYILREIDPSGFTSTTPNLFHIYLPPGGSVVHNFGDQAMDTVSGRVFTDFDGDGLYDWGEIGMSGVVITLDSATITTTTGFSGTYLFTDVTPGPHRVTVTNPPGFDNTTSPLLVVSVPPDGGATANFGLHPAGLVCGMVFNDCNGSGIQDSGENRLCDVTLELWKGGCNLVATETTDCYGIYCFYNVEKGSYTVVETDPEGFVSTTPNVVSIYVPAGGYASVTFGDHAIGVVSGRVFYDFDGDGIQDWDEEGIGGITVELDGQTRKTVENGSYIFTGLVSGAYTVVETDPPGFISTTPNTLTVSMPSVGTGFANFGDQPPEIARGVVFYDWNGDGELDIGERGIAGVTVSLSDTVSITTTATAGDGRYIFIGVTEGAYTVIETDPSGFASTTENVLTFSVPAGGSIVASFGDQRIGSVSGLVFDDPDTDGVQDRLERGIGGVTVTISNTTPIADMTSGDGRYIFTEVLPGSYTVVEADPLGFTSTTSNSVPILLPLDGSAWANFGDQMVVVCPLYLPMIPKNFFVVP